MPVHFHNTAGANKLNLGSEPGASDSKMLAIGSANSFALSSQIFANLLLGGVLERFPKLTFVGAESGIGWVPYVLEACDYEWERNQLYKQGLAASPATCSASNATSTSGTSRRNPVARLYRRGPDSVGDRLPTSDFDLARRGQVA